MIENEFGEFFPPTIDRDGNSYNSQFTLRDYFAAKALQAELSAQSKENGFCVNFDDFSDRAYKIADSMLERRKS